MTVAGVEKAEPGTGTQPAAAAGAARRRHPIAAVFGVLGSFGLTVTILVLLTLLTWVGTLDQVEHGLFEAQKKYFDSLFLVQQVGPFGVPLPGAALLMWVLAANLVCGGLYRLVSSYARGLRRGRLSRSKRVAMPFLIVAHLGILMLLAAGLVKYQWAREGHLTIWPAETKSEYESWHEWEVEISEPLGNGNYRQYLIPHEDFFDLQPDQSRRFTSAALPFDVTLLGFTRNAWPVPAGKGSASRSRGRAVGGWRLEARRPNKAAEANLAGAYAIVTEKASGTRHEILLWGARLDERSGGAEPSYPATFEAGGKLWGIRLRHRTWALPFSVRLEKFTRVLHPGTSRPKSFASDVTVLDDAGRRPVEISMNRPLRYRGHILFQSNWGPQDPTWRGELFSDFSVVDNPSDQWPLFSCIVIGIGLLGYLSVKLVVFVLGERKRGRRAASAA